VIGPADSYVSFGSPVRLRDLDRDGKADLTVGANGDALLMRGTSTTPTATGSVHLPEYGGGFLD
jgi:hypothetical protein